MKIGTLRKLGYYDAWMAFCDGVVFACLLAALILREWGLAALSGAVLVMMSFGTWKSLRVTQDLCTQLEEIADEQNKIILEDMAKAQS